MMSTELKWKLLPGCSVTHLMGSVYILDHSAHRSDFPCIVVRNMLGEPISPFLSGLTSSELRAIADWMDKLR